MLLTDPGLVRTEITKRLEQVRTADPATVQRKRLDAGLTKTTTAITRLIGAFQEQLISLDELRDRMPELRSRETSLRDQLNALDAPLADREVYLQLADNLEHLVTRLRDRAASTTITERQRVLRLLMTAPRPTRRAIHGLIANCVGGVLHPSWPTWSCTGWIGHGRSGISASGCSCTMRTMRCICCPTRERAEAALAALGEILSGLGLSLAADKTRIVHVADGTQGYDFLGFHHRMVPSRRNPTFRYPACWPSDRAMRRARSRVRELTGRNRRHVRTHLLVEDLNRFLRDWRQYFRYGNSARSFAKLDRHVTERMALLVSKRHGRHGRGNGMKHIIMFGNRLGLQALSGNVRYGRLAHADR